MFQLVYLPSLVGIGKVKTRRKFSLLRFRGWVDGLQLQTSDLHDRFRLIRFEVEHPSRVSSRQELRSLRRLQAALLLLGVCNSQ